MQSDWHGEDILYYHADDFPANVIGAVGKKVAGFTAGPGSTNLMTITAVSVGAGTSTLVDKAGGYLLTTAAGENDGINAQVDGVSFQCLEGKPFSLAALVQLSDATQSDLIFGLAPTGTTDIRGGVNDGVYFDKPDGTAALKAVTLKDGTDETTDAVATLANATDIELVIYWDGVDKVLFFVNGAQVASHSVAASLPDDIALALSLVGLAGAAGVDTVTFGEFRGHQFHAVA